MRVKKDGTTNRETNKPLHLNVTNDTPQSQTSDELDTPLLFDQSDFFSSNELEDGMPYSTVPFYPTSIYPYGEYNQGQYLDQGSYEALMNSLFSPGDSQDAADEDTEPNTSSVNKIPFFTNDLLVPNNGNIASSVITPNLENYSLKVKVRHPEKPQKDSATLSIQNAETKNRENNSVEHPEQIVNTRSGSNIQLLTTIKNPPADEVIEPAEKNSELNFSEDETKHLQHVLATPVPTGTTVLENGTLLLPANVGNIVRKGNTAHIVSHFQPSVISKAVNNTANNLIPALPDISSTTIDSSEITITDQPAVSSNTVFEPASPTPTPNSSSVRRTSPKGSRITKLERVTSGKNSQTVVSQNQNSDSLHTTHNKKIKVLHNQYYNPELFVDVSTETSNKNEQKLTPVSTITNIVSAAKKNEMEENVILKEAVSKPIKHRTNITDIETAKERSVKNAINARVNRQKHKVYVQTLEDENNELKNQVWELTSANDVLKQEKELLNKEVVYLKSVIANQSSLSNVLSGLNNLENVQLSSSFAKKYLKRSSHSSLQNTTENKRSRKEINDSSQDIVIPQVSGGVCIHVKGQEASLELCGRCSEMASEVGDQQNE